MSEVLVVNGVEYVPADSPQVAGSPSENRIVVADRGWVFVGPTSKLDDGSLVIRPAKCVRRWGTDELRPGLGWLAANGPTENSRLEPSGTVRIPAHAVVMTIDTEASLWQ